MLELVLWAFLIGGMPTSGYYLYKYGRQLHAKGKKMQQHYVEPEENQAQWKQELMFGVHCCLWAGTGLLLLHMIQIVSPVL